MMQPPQAYSPYNVSPGIIAPPPVIQQPQPQPQPQPRPESQQWPPRPTISHYPGMQPAYPTQQALGMYPQQPAIALTNPAAPGLSYTQSQYPTYTQAPQGRL